MSAAVQYTTLNKSDESGSIVGSIYTGDLTSASLTAREDRLIFQFKSRTHTGLQTWEFLANSGFRDAYNQYILPLKLPEVTATNAAASKPSSSLPNQNDILKSVRDIPADDILEYDFTYFIESKDNHDLEKKVAGTLFLKTKHSSETLSYKVEDIKIAQEEMYVHAPNAERNIFLDAESLADHNNYDPDQTINLASTENKDGNGQASKTTSEGLGTWVYEQFQNGKDAIKRKTPIPYDPKKIKPHGKNDPLSIFKEPVKKDKKPKNTNQNTSEEFDWAEAKRIILIAAQMDIVLHSKTATQFKETFLDSDQCLRLGMNDNDWNLMGKNEGVPFFNRVNDLFAYVNDTIKDDLKKKINEPNEVKLTITQLVNKYSSTITKATSLKLYRSALQPGMNDNERNLYKFLYWTRVAKNLASVKEIGNYYVKSANIINAGQAGDSDFPDTFDLTEGDNWQVKKFITDSIDDRDKKAKRFGINPDELGDSGMSDLIAVARAVDLFKPTWRSFRGKTPAQRAAESAARYTVAAGWASSFYKPHPNNSNLLILDQKMLTGSTEYNSRKKQIKDSANEVGKAVRTGQWKTEGTWGLREWNPVNWLLYRRHTDPSKQGDKKSGVKGIAIIGTGILGVVAAMGLLVTQISYKISQKFSPPSNSPTPAEMAGLVPMPEETATPAQPTIATPAPPQTVDEALKVIEDKARQGIKPTLDNAMDLEEQIQKSGSRKNLAPHYKQRIKLLKDSGYLGKAGNKEPVNIAKITPERNTQAELANNNNTKNWSRKEKTGTTSAAGIIRGDGLVKLG